MSDQEESAFYSESAIRTLYEKGLDDALTNLEMTPDERDWGQKANLAGGAERHVGSTPLFVSEVMVNCPGQEPEPLKGIFVVALDESDTTPYLLFTLSTGLIKFSGWPMMSVYLENAINSQRPELIHFFPLRLRQYVGEVHQSSFTRRLITGPVFLTVCISYEIGIEADGLYLLSTLTDLPSLRSVARDQLQKGMTAQFEAYKSLHPDCSVGLETHHVLTSSPEVDYVLAHYCNPELKDTWEIELIYATSCGLEGVTDFKKDKHEVAQWLNDVSHTLSNDLTDAIKAQWHTEEPNNFSLSTAIEHAVRDRFIYDLLQARHVGKITDSEFIKLHRYAFSFNDEAMKTTAVVIGNLPELVFNVVGWYCIHLGGADQKVLVMTDVGLECFATTSELFKYLKQRLTLSTLKLAASDSGNTLSAPLSHYLSHLDRVALSNDEEPRIYLKKQTDHLFKTLQQSFLDKAIADTEYLCAWYPRNFPRPQSFTPPDSASHVHALMDDALDIRALINPGLIQLSDSLRWGREVSIKETDIEVGEYFLIRKTKSGHGIKKYLNTVSEELDSYLETLPTLKTCAYHLLKEAWKTQEDKDLDLGSVLIEIPANATRPASSRSLVDAVLEHVTKYQPLPADSRDVSFTVSTDTFRPRLKMKSAESKTLHSVLLETGKDFVTHAARYFQRFLSDESSPQTVSNRLQMAALKSNVLWGDGYHYFRYSKQLSVHDAGCIAAVNAHRQRKKRHAYYYFVPEIYSISLSAPDVEIEATLTDCFVITEHGGLQSDCAGHAILWTPSRRFEAFPSVDICRETLQSRLSHPTAYLELVSCMFSAHQALVEAQRHLLTGESPGLFKLERLTGDYLVDLANDTLDQQLSEIKDALRRAIQAGLPSEACHDAVQNYVERIRAGFNLSGFLYELETIAFKKKMPLALQHATSQEQYEYALILERYHAAFKDEQDYLYGIPNLASYALTLLNSALEKDFPLLNLDAATVRVTLLEPSWIAKITATESARSEAKLSLIEYVLNGLNLPSGTLTFSTVDSSPLPEALNGHYLKALIKTLNIHATYRALLHDKLDPERPEFKKRFTLYSHQLPAQTLESAFIYKLSNLLSDTGYRHTAHVLNFPDGMARPLYNETTITLRPLQLCVSSTAEPDTVKGMYLIGPLNVTQGPLVLWITYCEAMTFQEFANESSLITALVTHERLQTEVLKRVPKDARSKYENGGFSNPHVTFITRFFPISDIIPQDPVSISNRPILGNFLAQLYRENLDFLLEIATPPAGKLEQSDAAFFSELISLGASTFLPAYFPARLSIPIQIVQTLELLKDSVSAGYKGLWGEAITDFVVALGLTISQTFTHSKKRVGDTRQTPFEPYLPNSPDQGVSPAVRLARHRAEQAAALDAYIDHSVSLKDLDFEVTTRIYHHKTRPDQYVALGGKLYPVTSVANRWRIVIDGEREGPAVKLNSINRWELDLYEPLLGGGPVVSRPGRDPIGHSSFPIEIVGMPLMQALRPDKAAAIVLAHQTAINYLTEACTVLKAFNSNATQYAHLSDWLKNHLGVPLLLKEYVDKINSASMAILGRLLKRSMNPLTSLRYVSGKKPPSVTPRVAFVNRLDAVKYIYLDEFFFQPPISPYSATPLKGLKKTTPTFNVDTHWRAVTLIHEVSHQMFNTEDIAYVNSNFPYPELFEPNSQNGLFYRTALEKLQNNALSNSTLRSDLFRNIDPDSQAFILKETGAHTLDEAKDAFMSNPAQRVNIILSNADSLTLIIARLGGKIDQYVPANP